MSTRSVAFFGIAGDPYSASAEEHLQSHFGSVRSFLGTNDVPPTTPDPGVLDVDWLFSFKTKVIFRAHTIASVRLGALNFHTACPDYPGSGGVNWALYNGDATSAITVHELTTSVDAGRILRVDRFDCHEADSVARLLELTYKNQLTTFLSVTSAIADQGEDWMREARAHAPEVSWGEKTYRIRDLENLKRIAPDMTAEEVSRRIRATSYGSHGPYIELHGHHFKLVRHHDDGD